MNAFNNPSVESTHVASVSPLILIGKDTRDLIARILLLARGSLRVGGDELQRQGNTLIRNLEAFSALAELAEQDKVFVDERMDLLAVIEEAGNTLAEQGFRPPLIQFESVGGEGSTLYGCRRWLLLALTTLLQRVSGGCHRSHVVTVKLRNMGQQITVAVGSEPGSNKPQPQRTEKQHADQTEAELAPFPYELDLMLCRRIMELHGGHLKLMPNEDITEDRVPVDALFITLPTGLPDVDRHRPVCQECPITLQSLQLAEDISRLLQNHDPIPEAKR